MDQQTEIPLGDRRRRRIGPGRMGMRKFLEAYKATQAEKLEREAASRKRMEAWRKTLMEEIEKTKSLLAGG